MQHMKVSKKQYIVEFKPGPDGYEGNVTGPGLHPRWRAVKLCPEDEVILAGESYTLQQILDALVQGDPADPIRALQERGQIDLGQYLFSQVFGALELTAADWESAEIDIQSPDEHIGRLPWALLACGGSSWRIVRVLSICRARS